MKIWIQIITLIATISSTSVILASGNLGEGEQEEKSTSMAPLSNLKWRTECSSCHMLYHPGLLPERSWNKIMGGLDKHFGENASLDASTRDEIYNFLAANGADKSDNRRSKRINQSISANNAPIRISETRYFTSRHDEISANTFKRKSIGSRSNCIACHHNAEKGDFSESQIKIPR